jgi:ribosome-associated protein
MATPRGIRVTDGRRVIVVPGDALEWQFVRSSGPGGQHVNRTSSKAVLRFDIGRCPDLPEDVRQRFWTRERSRLTQEGTLVITSQRHREQPRNAADCLAKLSAILERALVPPTPRRRTKTPRSAIRERLDEKKRRSKTKRLRGRPDDRTG